MSNAVSGKKNGKLGKQSWRKTVNNKKDYLNWTSKTSYTTKKIFDNDLVAIHKIKTTLTLISVAYVGMYILELSKVPMYEFH